MEEFLQLQKRAIVRLSQFDFLTDVEEILMFDKKTILLITSILFSTVFIIGAMFTIAERFDRRFDLETKISELKTENAQLEVLLDQALKTLHHERLMHFGTTSPDMEGRK